MNQHDQERKYGLLFRNSFLLQHLANKAFTLTTEVLVGFGTIDCLLVPKDRPRNTFILYAGAVGVWGAKHLMNQQINSVQDDILWQGTESFYAD